MDKKFKDEIVSFLDAVAHPVRSTRTFFGYIIEETETKGFYSPSPTNTMMVFTSRGSADKAFARLSKKHKVRLRRINYIMEEDLPEEDLKNYNDSE